MTGMAALRKSAKWLAAEAGRFRDKLSRDAGERVRRRYEERIDGRIGQ